MNRLESVRQNQLRRKARIRSTVSGTAARPRLSVHISNTEVTAQVINDETGKTLAYATSVGQTSAGTTMTEKASSVGALIGKKAKTAKIESVVFDRNGRLYHGRIKALAEAARKEGLEF